MIRSPLQLIPACVVLLALSACGGGGGEGAAEQAGEAAATATDAATEAATQAADAAGEAADDAADATGDAAEAVAEGAGEAADAAADTATAAGDSIGEAMDIDPAAWQEIELDWDNKVASVLEAFPDLSPDEITATSGNPEQLVALVEEKYGLSREEAQAKVTAWASSL